jgi:hypothetical protein
MVWRLAILCVAALVLTAVDSSSAKPAKKQAAKPANMAAAAGSRLHEDGDVLVWWQDGSLAVPRSVADSQSGVRGTERLKISAARNEHEPFQVVLSPKRGGLVFEAINIGPLRHARSGAVIAADHARAYFVGYANERHPDVLMPVDAYSTIPARENFNLWIVAYVPPDAAAGDYSGELELKLRGRASIRVPYALHVWDFTLPKDTRFWTQLFALSKRALANRYGLSLWSPEFETLVSRIHDQYAERRISPASPMPVDFSQITPVPALVTGRHGQGARFDGKVSIDIVPNSHINLDGQFSIMAWLKPSGRGGERTIFAHGFQANGVEFGIDKDGRLFLDVGDGHKKHRTQSRAAVAERWQHAAVSFDNGRVQFFVDGAPDAVTEVAVRAPSPGWETMEVGRQFRGDMDDFRVFTRAMEAPAVAVQMNNSGGDAAPPILAYDFETDPFKDRHLRSATGPETIAYYTKWVQYWRGRGLYAGQFYVPRTDENELRNHLKVWYPVLQRLGITDRVYIRLPHDERSAGPQGEANRKWANIIRQLAPGVPVHMTFGGKPNKDWLPTLTSFAGLIDIWALQPTVEARNRAVDRFFDERRQKGEHESWYIHHYMGLDVPFVGVRLFFWRAMVHDVSMATWWRTTHWARPRKADGRRREKETNEVERGFTATHEGGGVGPGGGLGFWPGRTAVYPSIRLEMVREGIEDFEYRQLLKDLMGRSGVGRGGMGDRAKAAATMPPEIERLLTKWVNPRNLPADPTIVKTHRARMAEAIEQLSGGRQ